jgi:hypothetical protein
VFFGDAKERDKFPVIVARSISPHFDDDSRYLDKEEHENELNQVLESVDRVLSLSKGEKLFVGSHGIILVTPDHEAYEEVLSVAAFLCSLQILQRNVSTRMWILWDEVRETRERILSVPESDTEGVSQIQHTLSDISATVVLLDEIAKYMAHAVAAVEGERDDVRKRKDARAARLAEALRLDRQLEMRRDVVKDIAMSVSGLHNEVQGLRDVAATISEKQMRRTNEALEESIAEMQEMNRASERTSSAVEVLEVMMAGSISFSIVNTLPGQYTSPTFSEFAAANPYTWLLIIIAVWAVIGYGLYRIMSLLEWRSEKDLRVHLRFDRKVDIERLRAYLVWCNTNAIN